jgi:hypothetical protein
MGRSGSSLRFQMVKNFSIDLWTYEFVEIKWKLGGNWLPNLSELTDWPQTFTFTIQQVHHHCFRLSESENFLKEITKFDLNIRVLERPISINFVWKCL